MKSFYNEKLAELNAKVTKVEKKGNYLLVSFDDTIFYPGGGGQPCDIGIVASDNFQGEVILVDEKDDIVHEIRPTSGSLKVGDKVSQKINVKRRHSLVRMHTGEHIFFKSLQKVVPDLLLDKISLGEEESKLFVFAKSLSWKEIFEAEKIANEIIRENKKITEKEYPRDEALKMEGLRIKPERIPGNIVRVIEVEGFDLSACRGIHAHNTGFVGSFLVTKFSKTSNGAEIRFMTDASKELFGYASLLRESSNLLGTNPEQVPEFIQKLQKDSAELKAKFRDAASKLAMQAKNEQVGSRNLIWNVVEGLDNRQMSDIAMKLCKDRAIVAIVNKGQTNSVIIAASKDSGLEASKILNQVLQHFGGRGGGRELLANGSFTGSVDNFISNLKELLENS